VDRPDYERSVATARYLLDEASWRAAWAEGRVMQPEEAIEYALSREESTTSLSPVPEQRSPGELPATLTRREKEVAALVGRGLTTRQIASELVLSKRTVDHHVASILKKLNLHSREEIASRLNK
jgi:DNA-binding NarL/FixJ family response regulator